MSTSNTIENQKVKNTDSFTPFYIPDPPYDKIIDLYEKREFIKQRLALAYRVFAAHNMEEGAAGHLTVRDSVNRDMFWVTPFGVPFELMTASDLLLIDHHGKIVEGGKPDLQYYNSAAFVIHAAIHSARPDANAVCHSHSVYSKAFCAFGRPLSMISQDSCMFYDDHAVYNNFGGVVLKGQESQEIVNALGRNKAALLSNHGLLTVGNTIESATFWFYSMEKQCQVELLVNSASQLNGWSPKIIPHDVAQFTYENTADEKSGWFEGQALFKAVEVKCSNAHKQ